MSEATTAHIAAFQQVLHASMSWPGTRMDWVDGVGSVRTCKRREGAGQGGSAGRKIHRQAWGHVPGWQGRRKAEQRDGARASIARAGQDNAARLRCWLLLSPAHFVSQRAPSQDFSKRPAAVQCSAVLVQHMRAQANSPVQLLINSSTSSSSVTVVSQGHLQRHAARSDSR